MRTRTGSAVHFCRTLLSHGVLASLFTLLLIPASIGEETFLETDPAVSLSAAEPSFTLQLLHTSDLEGGVETIQLAPRFSAWIEGFRAEYPDTTILLSSGDNFIPGPFSAAASDRSLGQILGREGIARADIS
ncbi:MAG: hypothetical protein HC921_08050 [Synechococcaceae cyanobacterium SM2_3_1]|nr:hypothetical protein [Synechococcaceae cyanobacterium SM2_3_1]